MSEYQLCQHGEENTLTYCTPYTKQWTKITFRGECLLENLDEILVRLATRKLGRYEAFYSIAERMRKIDPFLTQKRAIELLSRQFIDGYHVVAAKDVAALIRKTMPARITISTRLHNFIENDPPSTEVIRL
jgi:hypothetical protein